MNELFCDFETTGFANRKPLNDPSQPHVVAMALIMRHEKKIIGRVHMELNCTVPSDEGALKVHGLTLDHLQKYGVPPMMAARVLYRYLTISDVFISHNMGFDGKIADILLNRFATIPSGEDSPARHCTMKLARQFTAGSTGSSLDAACSTHLGEDAREGHHDCFDDVERCMRLWDYFEAKSPLSDHMV